jgi:hypothetical protein
MVEEAPGREPEPAIDDEAQARRPTDSITDFGAVAFLFALFLLALGLMYLIGAGRG